MKSEAIAADAARVASEAVAKEVAGRGFFDLFRYGAVFLRYARWQYFYLLVLIVVGGAVDAFSLSMVLPMLNVSLEAGSGAGTDYISRTVFGFLHFIGVAPSLGSLLVLMILVFVLKGCISFMQNFLMLRTSVNLTRDLQLRLAELIGGMKYLYYIQQNTGWLNNLMIRETERFSGSFLKHVNMTVGIVRLVAYLAVAFTLRWDLTLALIAFGAVLGLLFRRAITQTRRLSFGVTEGAASLQGYLAQLIHQYVYLRATNSVSELTSRMRDRVQRLSRYQLRFELLNGLMESIREPLAVIILAAVVYQHVAIEGKALGDILVLALFLNRVFAEMMALQSNWQRFNQGVASIHSVDKACSEMKKQREKSEGRSLQSLGLGDIIFHDVSFRYPEKTVIDAVSLTLPRRKTIGIVGPSGAGKTTFFHLLTGMLEPSSGQITIGSADYADLDKAALRRRIGYVTQDPAIFDDTLGNNISLWSCDNAIDECRDRIRTAAIQAELHDFADDLDLMLGERGVRLSGGQRQRIAIAREIFKNPDLLIFDEATSSLDSQTEAAIQKSIDGMHGERTIVIIAHRLSTVRNCDVIYVFDKGSVVESGSFEALYTQSGSLFRALCDQQHIRL